jgi:hypothetical protein
VHALVASPGALLLSGWVLGTILLAASYGLAGHVWVERHSLKFNIGSRPAQCSGAVGESIILGVCAGILYLVDITTPAFSILEVLAQHARWWIVTACVMGGVILTYSVLAAVKSPTEGQPPDVRGRLVRAYLVYSGYSTLIFTGGLVLLFTLVSQFTVDAKIFHEATSRVLAAAVPTSTSGDVLMATVEKTYLDSMTILNSVKDQMAPVFIFAVGIFVVNLLILHTPVRSLFLDNAVFLTNLSTLVAILAIAICGAAVYIGAYSGFVNDYVSALTKFKEPLANASWQAMSRYSTIFFIVDGKKNPIAFITEMANEWGGLAAVLGMIQWAISQFKKPGGDASSADREGPGMERFSSEPEGPLASEQ